MKSKFITKEIKYTGAQLSSLWAYTQFGLEGDSIVSFLGPCEVKLKQMVDLKDQRARETIFSRKMLHFIVEHFDTDLEKAVLRQWLLVNILKDKLNHRLEGDVVQRWGNDLFDGEHKLTISVATVTPVSTKIHLGINILSQGTPVKTRGLKDYGIDPQELAEVVMTQYLAEMKIMNLARCKVRGVE